MEFSSVAGTRRGQSRLYAVKSNRTESDAHSSRLCHLRTLQEVVDRLARDPGVLSDSADRDSVLVRSLNERGEFGCHLCLLLSKVGSPTAKVTQ
jgi:hypothetical protein